MNHPMQGTAADIMKLAMIEVDRRLRAEGFRSRMVLQVHDELVFESPAEEVERLSAMAREAMSGVAQLAVPLDVSVASGANWAVAEVGASAGQRPLAAARWRYEGYARRRGTWRSSAAVHFQSAVQTPSEHHVLLAPGDMYRVPIGDEMSCTRD